MTKTLLAALVASAVCLSASPAGAGGTANRVTTVDTSETDGVTEIRIRGTRTPTFTVYKLRQPTRVVVDIANAELGESVESSINTWGVSHVSASSLDGGSQSVVRVVVRMARPGAYKVKAVGKDVVVTVTPRDPTPVGSATDGDRAAVEAERKKAEAARVKAEERERAANRRLAEAEARMAEAERALAELEKMRREAEAARARAEQREAAAERARADAEKKLAEADAAAKRAETLRAEAQAAAASKSGDAAAKKAAADKAAPRPWPRRARRSATAPRRRRS